MAKAHTQSKRERPEALDGKIPIFRKHHSRDELIAAGKKLREKCPRSSHAVWKAPHNRPDPVRLVEQGDTGRIPHLIPIRHGRMLQSPFTLYRGAALNMAADLATTPASGICVQACGDAHLLNTGCYATPERRIIFSINDLDETLPAPWEWDVKRLAASVVLACRDNGLSEANARDATLACISSYRQRMSELSQMRTTELWYADLEATALISTIRNRETQARAHRALASAKARSVAEHDFPKLAHVQGESALIKDNAPTIFHWQEDVPVITRRVRGAFARYRESLPPARRVLLDRFEFKDFAIKVVGIGSVGTACWVILLMAGEKDPLFLQAKEARPSVLEAYAGKSVFSNHGERIVNGYQLMQPSSDIFLGWTQGEGGRHYYVRQLRDVKIKFRVERFNSSEMAGFAGWCGLTLALSHARSGDPAMISGYLGKSDVFDKAILAFATAYADQTEKDYGVLKKAAKDGRLEVVLERESG